MFTFQDFEKYAMEKGEAAAVQKAIDEHKSSADYEIARQADLYEKQRSPFMTAFVRKIFNLDGTNVKDPTTTILRMCNNGFQRLMVQRVTYSLGNGIEFNRDGLKERLGANFDTTAWKAVYAALKHKVSFVFFDGENEHVFPYTEFAPLYDERSGELMAGVRFWRIDDEKPMHAVLYTRDGYTAFRSESRNGILSQMSEVERRKAYKVHTEQAEIDAEETVVSEENFAFLPIIPWYANRTRQSALVGLKPYLDSIDLLRNGLVSDVDECSQAFWIVNGDVHMDDGDIQQFRDRLKLLRMATVAGDV